MSGWVTSLQTRRTSQFPMRQRAPRQRGWTLTRSRSTSRGYRPSRRTRLSSPKPSCPRSSAIFRSEFPAVRNLRCLPLIVNSINRLEGLPGTLSFWQNTALYGLGGGDRSSAGSPAYSPIQHSSSSGSPFPSAASGGSAAAPAMPPATSQISSHPPMSSDLQRLLHQPKQPQPAQQPQQQDAPPASTEVPAKRRSREERVRISKAELQSVSACLPKSVFALIERVISEQEGEKEAVLPLSCEQAVPSAHW